MGNRLSKIATRTGDDGSTGLGDGTRVKKSTLRVHAMGEIDETNTALGVLLAESLPESLRVRLTRIQNHLFDLGGEVCIPGHAAMTVGHVAFLDEALTQENADLPPLKEFILPGGTRAAAACHAARVACRRAERSLVALSDTEAVSVEALQYLNRLSDLLFVEARVLNRAAGHPEPQWRRETFP
ncbi:MAG: cob(I)yrinic acid a,c-diamide adenosyltransferase [Betaproteobacteria bacterium]|nr:cob(I)yrinic acid a,c-diamide adenosyltransferase [Betaproteobacteria bacterium]